MQVRDEDIAVPPPASDTPLTPDTAGDELPPADTASDGGAAGQRSFFDDAEALIDDARTYWEAEVSYQKSRAGFVGNRLKKAIAFGAVAAFFAVLATIGLTVGLIIALTPFITAWGATAAVVIGLLLIAYLLVRGAGKAWADLSEALSEKRDDADG
ncbi:phage holin family protein [Aurantiacibacter sp. D1-12]|uniref:phage holin family protein n=1 Tax=Aurantiacibacter sp. D1-12 TaxID=2993658 RepID=UPI00237CBDD1|nr:phage holin family protein [Aurantiacibacter sp. D1-12]MDE1466790.1 phage holin family protein [Aurantiacibacter sp. D1-12]